MTSRHLIVATVIVVATLLLGVLVFRDDLARWLWRAHQLPAIALVLDHGDAKLAMELGNYYFGGQANTGTSGVYDLQKAELAYKTAVRIEPSILWGNYQLARVYLVQGRFDDALVAINRELEANPENLRALYIRGLTYGFRLRAGDLRRAEADLLQFIEWAPSEWAGYNDLNWVLLEQKKYEEVKKVSEHAFERVPEGDVNPWILNSLGVSHLNLKEYARAKDILRKALREAEKLTENDWYKAYTGNDPGTAHSGLESFKEGIRKNIQQAEMSVI